MTKRIHVIYLTTEELKDMREMWEARLSFCLADPKLSAKQKAAEELYCKHVLQKFERQS